MTINWRTIIVGYDEPTLWISVVLATILATAGGVSIGVRIVRRAPGITRWATGVWLGFLLAGASTVIAYALFSFLFFAATGANACVPLVGRILLLPAVAGLGSEAAAWWLTAKRLNHAV